MKALPGNPQKKNFMKAEGREMYQIIILISKYLCLGSRGIGEHHRAYGGYSMDIMTGICTFHRRVHSRISLHLRTKYSREEDENAKRFERVQKDKSRGEGSSGKSTEEEFHESSRKRNVSNHYFNT